MRRSSSERWIALRRWHLPHGAVLGFATVAMLLAPSYAPALYDPITPFRWDGLPPRTDRVDLITPFDHFWPQMGYLSDWFILKTQSIAYDEAGHRLFQSDGLTFNFVEPGGGMNDSSTNYETRVYDSAGRPNPDATVVWFDHMKRLDLTRYVPGEVAAIDQERPDRLHLTQQGDLGHNPFEHFEDYRGMTIVAATNEKVGFSVDCDVHANCLGDIYFEKRAFDFRFWFQYDRRTAVFAICAKASELLAAWSSAP